ncbi:MAG: DUF3307 domain-containing protein [Bacteroidales bacterium]|nr:DUF3307 domain-containing protein [Bacteroidales bacterium]
MELLSLGLLLRIFIAHFLSDFLFQPASWAKEKDGKGIKSPCFWYHIAITTGLTAIMLGDIQYWSVLLFVGIGHLIIDALKTKVPNSGVWVFLTDQLLHILVIVAVWLGFTGQFQLFINLTSELFNIQRYWGLLFFYIILGIPSSVLIGKMTQRWTNELDGTTKEGNNNGLKDAGKWIGILERLLIFTFIIINELSAIGFLLAAKSVFRFGDLKDSSGYKKTEYIIIGTLLSFSIAIAAGLIYKHATN